MNQETRQCQNCKQGFVIEPQDFKFYEKMQVPPPTFCPECRLIRRLAWRNERSMYARRCDKCGKEIIAIYSPDKSFTVYCQPCWWADDWDAMQYGVDFDPQKPFLLQLRELFSKVPMMCLHGLYTTIVNSDYTHMVSYLKNCYMVTYADFGEDLIYGSFVNNSKDSVDNTMLDHSELCHETVNCIKCYRAFFSVDCENCHNIWFSKNLVGCSDCFGCVNLRHKSYHIFNKAYSKGDYLKKLEELNLNSYQSISKLKEKVRQSWLRFPVKFYHGSHNQNVSGEYIYNAKNVHDSFMIAHTEDSRFCFVSQGPLKDSYDFSHYGVSSELLYEGLQSGDHVSSVRFSWWIITNSRNIEYCLYLVNCENMFGCVGLKRKKYCILNKQYSKESFDKLRTKIIEQMNTHPYRDKNSNEYRYGEFFPTELSSFGYNETTAQEFFPLSAEAVAKAGYKWKQLEVYQRTVTVVHDQLPDDIKDVPDSITNEIIQCAHSALKTKNEKLKTQCNEQCTTVFRIIPQELNFYRKMNLPLPRLCPNCRHSQRLKFRNPMKLWHRKCQCGGKASDNGLYQNTIEHFHELNHCLNEFETTYMPERKEIVYCEQCYQVEVA